MFLPAVILSILVGKLRGGSLRRLGEIPFRWMEPIILAFIVQAALKIGGDKGWAINPRIAPVIYVITYLVLLAGMWLNRHIYGMPYIGVGTILNFLAIVANGGRMPVSGPVLLRVGLGYTLELFQKGRVYTHALIDEGTRLAFLGDVIPLPRPYPWPEALSPGDILIVVGIFLLVNRAMKPFKASLKA